MTFLPVVERELRVKARQAGVYYARILGAAAAFIILSMMILSSLGPRAGPNGFHIFVTLTVIAMLFCVFEGARSTADSISEEKREGTLGLLFLTDLKGHDVVLGKLAASSLQAIYLVIGFLPILAIPVMMGGITLGEYLRVSLVLIVTILMTVCLGIAISARSLESQKSQALSLGIAALFAGVLPLLDLALRQAAPWPAAAGLSLPSPTTAAFLAFDMHYQKHADTFWASVICMVMFSVLLLGLTFRNVMLHWASEATLGTRLTKVFLPKPESRSTARRRLDHNPIFWLGTRREGSRLWLWIALGTGLAGCISQLSPGNANIGNAIAHLTLMLSKTALLFFGAWKASQVLVEARRENTLELWLTTPLSVSDTMEGLKQAFRWNLRHPFLLGLTLLISSAIATQIFFWRNNISMGMSSEASRWLYVGFGVASSGVIFAADLLALSWVSAWLALVSKKPGDAVARSFVYVIVAPGFLMMFLPVLLNIIVGAIAGWFWIMGPLNIGLIVTKDILFIRWARRSLAARMRIVAAEGDGKRRGFRFPRIGTEQERGRPVQ
jgi:hypothetical protein